jgi:UDP-glucose 4-epimerase
MRVLVTGGAGYIGSVAVAALIERGDEVVVADNLWRGHRPAMTDGACFTRVDLRDRAGLRAALEEAQPEAVLHFAGATLVPESMREPLLYYETNVTGTINLLQAMLDVGADRLVFSSTAAVYGVPERLPIQEQDRLEPINPYGRSKLVAERIIADAGVAHGLHWAALRYFNVAGATDRLGEDHDPETHVIPVALQVALGQRPAFGIYGDDFPTPDGTAIRDYVHVVDLVDAHLRALDRLDETLGPINLGTKDGVSVRQIVEAVERVTGSPLPIVLEPRREGDPPALVADSSRALDALGWEPAHSTLDEMVSSAWSWMTRNPRGYGDATG